MAGPIATVIGRPRADPPPDQHTEVVARPVPPPLATVLFAPRPPPAPALERAAAPAVLPISQIARVIYRVQQAPDPAPPVVPAAERNPYTGAVEAMVPSGNLPVRDSRWQDVPYFAGAFRPTVVDPLVKEVEELERKVTALIGPLVADVGHLSRRLEDVEMAVRTHNRRLLDPPPAARAGAPSFWRRVRALLGGHP